MSIAVMQYICVVDDEMAPKMKNTPEGDTSKYKSFYGTYALIFPFGIDMQFCNFRLVVRGSFHVVHVYRNVRFSGIAPISETISFLGGQNGLSARIERQNSPSRTASRIRRDSASENVQSQLAENFLLLHAG